MEKISFAEFSSKMGDAIDGYNVHSGGSSVNKAAYGKLDIMNDADKSRGIESLSIEFQGETLKKGTARGLYIELTLLLCKDITNYEKLKAKNWFFTAAEVKDSPKRYVQISKEEFYICCDCNVNLYMLKCVRMMMDLGMKEEMSSTFFNYEYRLKEKKQNQDENVVQVVNAIAQETSIPSDIEHIYSYMKSKGFQIKEDLVKNLYISLKTKPFVILAGVSGTGKSKAVRLFSEAVCGNYVLIPVRPDWSDSTDLIGYTNLDGLFCPGKLTKVLYEANKKENANVPYYICLDEMNLARVEYYLSDVLSIIETRRLVDGKVISDSFFSNEQITQKSIDGKDYSKIYLSDNVYIIGTVNMDETTFPFSKKVLDRANTIEFSDIDLFAGTEDGEIEKCKPKKIGNENLKSTYVEFSDCYPKHKDDVNEVIALLDKINKVLTPINSQVAYRVRNEIAFFVSYAIDNNLFKFEEALDIELMQKILPRIQGSGELLTEAFRCIVETVTGKKFTENDLLYQISEYIKGFDDAYESFDYEHSIRKIHYMLHKLETEEYTSYWL